MGSLATITIQTYELKLKVPGGFVLYLVHTHKYVGDFIHIPAEGFMLFHLWTVGGGGTMVVKKRSNEPEKYRENP